MNSDLLPVVPPRPPEGQSRVRETVSHQSQQSSITVIIAGKVRLTVFIIPEAFEVKPQDLRQFVDHQLFLCFGQGDGFGGGTPSSSCKERGVG